jgi:NAD(P)-dependent dehydrogenase (short-subunit alcohol dehydrogenase family)
LGRLSGKVAIVTGAGGRIGGATARIFAREGARVVVADLNDATGEATVAAIRAADGQATFVHTDVGRGADVEHLVRQTVDEYGRLDVLFNNAARGLVKRIVDMTEAEWDAVQASTLKSVFFGAKYAAPVMARTGGGSIISTSSVNGILATPGLGAYNAAKAGVINLTRALALELAVDGIRVNCILPGHIEDRVPQSDPHTLAGFLRASPVGRYGYPEEIGNMALFLASDESSFATGASFTVDGGLSAQVAETVTVDRYRAFDRRVMPDG